MPGTNPEEPENTFQAPSAALRQTLSERMGDLSMLPEIAVEAIQLTNSRDCTVDEFGNVIRRDMMLATEILSHANKAIYSHGQSIDSLEQAIIRLGFRQCRNLIISSSAACLMKKLHLKDDWVKKVLWRHSFMTATACTLLNRSLSLGFQGEEYSCGLLHDFGRLLMAIVADQLSEVDTFEFREGPKILEKERAALGIDHCQFGAWFAKDAGLPASIIDAIRWHHAPETSSPYCKLIALTNAADDIANHIQREEDPKDYDPLENTGIYVLSQIMGANILKPFASIAETMLEEIQQHAQAESLA